MTQATSPPESIRTDELYVRNLCALWKADARLAMAIEAVHPDDIPAIEPARDGLPTAKVKGVYLHSRYRPLEEAQKWAEAQRCENRYAVVVSGFGLGHHITALWQIMPAEAMVIVAEPHLGVLKAAFGAMDFSEMIASRRLLIFTQLDRGQLIERLECRGTLFLGSEESDEPVSAGEEVRGAIENVKFTLHDASNRIAPEFHRSFQKLMIEFVAYLRTGLITLRDNSVLSCRNAANNLGRYSTTSSIDAMRDAYKGKPAILVAAGPSLAKNMHLLHEVNDPRHAVIISVQTMLKPLLAAGIDPDFVTSLDYNTVSTRFFENIEEAAAKTGQPPDVHLVAEAKANWNVLDVFGGGMSLIENDFAEKLLRGAGFPSRAGLKAGATVAHLSFYLAEFLGCDPIILVGQDLGFVDGLYYKPGTAIHETWGVELGRFCTLETKEWERIVRSRLILRKIPDIHGDLMYTEEQFFVYLQQFERDFALCRSRIIDATEGGAKKQGTEVMTLRAALDQFCKTPLHGPGGAAKPWKRWQCNVPATLHRVRETLALRRSEADAMRETCEAVLPLLDEMMVHQEDAARMQRLFVEVDRLRTKVGADPGTFEMAAFLNTIGEMRRYQADLTVNTEQPDSPAKQRRQLIRDKAYVKDLRLGAQRLIEIIDDAIIRLEKQIAASEAGKPWPREVAGASV